MYDQIEKLFHSQKVCLLLQKDKNESGSQFQQKADLSSLFCKSNVVSSQLQILGSIELYANNEIFYVMQVTVTPIPISHQICYHHRFRECCPWTLWNSFLCNRFGTCLIATFQSTENARFQNKCFILQNKQEMLSKMFMSNNNNFVSSPQQSGMRTPNTSMSSGVFSPISPEIQNRIKECQLNRELIQRPETVNMLNGRNLIIFKRSFLLEIVLQL